MNSLFPVLALWGNKNGPPSMKVKKVENFQLFHFHTGRPILITPHPRELIREKGIHATSKLDDTKWVWVPGPVKLEHLQLFEPILFQKIFNFSLSYWEANSYFPSGLIIGKRGFMQLPNWMIQRGLGAWASQTGQFAPL